MNSPSLANLSRSHTRNRSIVVTESQTTDGKIPAGKYAVIVKDVVLIPGIRPTLVWTFQIQGGTYAGRLLRKVRPATDLNLAAIKEDLQKCGMKLNSLSHLPNRLEELCGTPLSVEKRPRAGNFAINILCRIPATSDIH